MDILGSLQLLHLAIHESARQRAVASCKITKGSIIVKCESLATVLLPEHKGRRCDACHVLNTDLRRCSGCASYWYCSTQCQTRDWKHHRHICKRFNTYFASEAFQALSAHEKMDSLLLSHTVASESDPQYSLFLTLLPGPASRITNLPICTDNAGRDTNAVYSRFGNNNFAIHSHLNTFGHGVFPLASRLFNHSCAPNAVAKYMIKPGQALQMRVVALQDIDEGTEVCLPYFDPAMIQSRQHITKYTYGFTCSCPSCVYIRSISHIPEPPAREDSRDVDEALVSLIFGPRIDLRTITLPVTQPRPQIPARLKCVFHESYLSLLSKAFSDAAHDRQYAAAMRDGVVLLALYVLLYPPNYPQIGMHLLEFAKTAWNAVLEKGGNETNVKIATRFLELSRDVLGVYGEEGDVEYGPVQEMALLTDLLSTSRR